MTIDDTVRDEKLQYYHQKYQNYHLENFKNMNILQVKKYYLPNTKIEQAKFAYSPLRKPLEKQTEKELGALKSLDLSNKKNKGITN